jgi:hypothetical protein
VAVEVVVLEEQLHQVNQHHPAVLAVAVLEELKVDQLPWVVMEQPI